MSESFIIQGYSTVPNQETAAFVIFNNETTDPRRLITVRGVEVRPSSPQPSASVPGLSNIRRISAMTAGSRGPVTISKLNLGSPDLPSQVSLLANCIVTATADAPFRRVMDCPVVGISTGNTYFGNATCTSGVPSGMLANWGDGVTEPITLNAGEGLAYVESTINHQFTWGCTVIFTIGSASYNAHFYQNASNGGEASWGLMNNTGSGVTIKVNQIFFSDIGTTDVTQINQSAPCVRYIRVHGVQGGEAMTPVPLNNDYPAPAALTAVRGTMQLPISVAYESGSQSLGDHAFPNGTAAQTLLVRKWGNFGNRMPYMGSLGGPGVAMADGNLMFPAPDFGPSMGMDLTAIPNSGIVLRPQEGLAMIAGNQSGFCDYYFRARVVHTPPGTIDANITQVNGVSVSGAGTAGNPWGPGGSNTATADVNIVSVNGVTVSGNGASPTWGP